MIQTTASSGVFQGSVPNKFLDIKEIEYVNNERLIYNLFFGLANHDLRARLDSSTGDQLMFMKRVIQTSSV
jgi:hypothetical protein